MRITVRTLGKHFHNIFLLMYLQIQLKILKLVLGVAPKTNKVLFS